MLPLSCFLFSILESGYRCDYLSNEAEGASFLGGVWWILVWSGLASISSGITGSSGSGGICEYLLDCLGGELSFCGFDSFTCCVSGIDSFYSSSCLVSFFGFSGDLIYGSSVFYF